MSEYINCLRNGRLKQIEPPRDQVQHLLKQSQKEIHAVDKQIRYGRFEQACDNAYFGMKHALTAMLLHRGIKHTNFFSLRIATVNVLGMSDDALNRAKHIIDGVHRYRRGTPGKADLLLRWAVQAYNQAADDIPNQLSPLDVSFSEIPLRQSMQMGEQEGVRNHSPLFKY